MASAWGASWGSAWGNAWGVIAAVQAAAGGIGHSKKVYIKRGDLILLFRDGDSAQAWLEQEKAAEQAHERSKPYRPRKPVPLKAKPWKVLELPKLRQLGAIYGEQPRIQSMLAKMDWAALMDIYNKLRMREDEDVLAILLAA